MRSVIGVVVFIMILLALTVEVTASEVAEVEKRMGELERDIEKELDEVDRIAGKHAKEETVLRESMEKLREYEKEVEEVHENIVYLENERDRFMERVYKVEAELDQLDRDVVEVTGDLVEAEDVLKTRMTGLQRENSVEWLGVLFSVRSLSDLMTTVKGYTTIVDKDKEVLAEVQKKREDLELLAEEEERELGNLHKLVGIVGNYETELKGEEEKYRSLVKRQEEEIKNKNSLLEEYSEEYTEKKTNVGHLQEELDGLRADKKELILEKESLAQESLEQERSEKEESVVSSRGYSLNEQEIMDIVKEENRAYGLPLDIVYGLIKLESGFNVKGYNDANRNGTVDRGVMQINNNTAPWLAGRLGYTYEAGLEYDPRVNIKMGLLYLNDQYKKGKGVHYALTAYNRGPGGANTLYQRQGSYESSYSRRVLEHSRGYR